MKYTDYSDEAIWREIKSDNFEAMDCLINRYKKIVKIKTRAYYINGSDRDDIVQEGMIGLFKAIRDYNPEKLVSFCSFADLCITRQIISAIKSANRQKNIPLNSYVSLSKTIFDERGQRSYLNHLTEKRNSNPEELLIGREDKFYIEKHIVAMLSALECNVLSLYLQGKGYVEISHIIGKDEKAIDNALQRVRRKVGKILSHVRFTKKITRVRKGTIM